MLLTFVWKLPSKRRVFGARPFILSQPCLPHHIDPNVPLWRQDPARLGHPTHNVSTACGWGALLDALSLLCVLPDCLCKVWDHSGPLPLHVLTFAIQWMLSCACYSPSRRTLVIVIADPIVLGTVNTVFGTVNDSRRYRKIGMPDRGVIF